MYKREIAQLRKRVRECKEMERVERSRLNNPNILRQIETIRKSAQERLDALTEWA